jgi:hypothetical protein
LCSKKSVALFDIGRFIYSGAVVEPFQVTALLMDTHPGDRELILQAEASACRQVVSLYFQNKVASQSVEKISDGAWCLKATTFVKFVALHVEVYVDQADSVEGKAATSIVFRDVCRSDVVLFAELVTGVTRYLWTCGLKVILSSHSSAALKQRTLLSWEDDPFGEDEQSADPAADSIQAMVASSFTSCAALREETFRTLALWAGERPRCCLAIMQAFLTHKGNIAELLKRTLPEIAEIYPLAAAMRIAASNCEAAMLVVELFCELRGEGFPSTVPQLVVDTLTLAAQTASAEERVDAFSSLPRTKGLYENDYDNNRDTLASYEGGDTRGDDMRRDTFSDVGATTDFAGFDNRMSCESPLPKGCHWLDADRSTERTTFTALSGRPSGRDTWDLDSRATQSWGLGSFAGGSMRFTGGDRPTFDEDSHYGLFNRAESPIDLASFPTDDGPAGDGGGQTNQKPQQRWSP